jgi:hypothetical protein
LQIANCQQAAHPFARYWLVIGNRFGRPPGFGAGWPEPNWSLQRSARQTHNPGQLRQMEDAITAVVLALAFK